MSKLNTCFFHNLQEIWDHSSRERKSLFPGASDVYRETNYVRHDTTQSFVADSLLETQSASA